MKAYDKISGTNKNGQWLKGVLVAIGTDPAVVIPAIVSAVMLTIALTTDKSHKQINNPVAQPRIQSDAVIGAPADSVALVYKIKNCHTR